SKVCRLAQRLKNRTIQFSAQIDLFAMAVIECQFKRTRTDNFNFDDVDNHRLYLPSLKALFGAAGGPRVLVPSWHAILLGESRPTQRLSRGWLAKVDLPE